MGLNQISLHTYMVLIFSNLYVGNNIPGNRTKKLIITILESPMLNTQEKHLTQPQLFHFLYHRLSYSTATLLPPTSAP